MVKSAYNIESIASYIVIVEGGLAGSAHRFFCAGCAATVMTSPQLRWLANAWPISRLYGTGQGLRFHTLTPLLVGLLQYLFPRL